MNQTFVFGYGSLVNGATHSHAPLYPARLIGWRRAWAKRYTARALTSLTIIPEDGAVTEGVIAAVSTEAWATLDAREAGYRRVELAPGQLEHTGPADARIITYSAPDPLYADDDHPILASYLDVVLQGFRHLGGEAAQRRFVDSTTGWSETLADDRARPGYPRATAITAAEQAAIDGLLPNLRRVPWRGQPHAPRR